MAARTSFLPGVHGYVVPFLKSPFSPSLSSFSFCTGAVDERSGREDYCRFQLFCPTGSRQSSGQRTLAPATSPAYRGSSASGRVLRKTVPLRSPPASLLVQDPEQAKAASSGRPDTDLIRVPSQTLEVSPRRLRALDIPSEHQATRRGPTSLAPPQPLHVSFRRCFLAATALCVPTTSLTLSLLTPLPCNADPTAEAQGSATSRKLPASLALDLSGWPLVVGQGFVLKIPPGFIDIMPPPENDNTPMSTTTMQNNAQKSPFIARYASSNGAETISVILQPATSLKLTFLEVDDISEFGSIDKAAGLFISSNAQVLARREHTTAWYNKRPRTYYLYEFVKGGQHCAMCLAAAGGSVFVVGAAAPQDRWRPAAGRLRAAVGAFQLTI